MLIHVLVSYLSATNPPFFALFCDNRTGPWQHFSFASWWHVTLVNRGHWSDPAEPYSRWTLGLQILVLHDSYYSVQMNFSHTLSPCFPHSQWLHRSAMAHSRWQVSASVLGCGLQALFKKAWMSAKGKSLFWFFQCSLSL